jgi:hypothetical protein
VTDDQASAFGPPSGADRTLWAATAPDPVRRSIKLPQGNEMLGIIYGVIAASVSGLVWYLVVTTTDRQFVYLAIVMGAIVGKTVSFGSGGSRVVNACFAVIIATVGMFAAYYFIDRHMLIEELGSNGRVPIWHSFMFARQLVSAGFDINPTGRIFTLVAAVLAGIVGYKETRSPR